MYIDINDTIKTEKFDVSKVHQDVVQWVRDFFSVNGPNCNAVIGISGGKDSSVAAAICVEALGKDRVIGVLMPNGEQNDIKYAIKLVNFLNIKHFTININDAYENIIDRITANFSFNTPELNYKVTDQTQINLPARLRMATLYAVSQSVNGRVVNTCNLSEDWVGYSTRYGDSAGDFSPFAGLTTDEVIAIGVDCGLPDSLVYKIPSDGLCGKTDEDNLGFTYAALNEYLRTGVCDNEIVKEKIDNLHAKNLFKLYPMPYFQY